MVGARTCALAGNSCTRVISGVRPYSPNRPPTSDPWNASAALTQDVHPCHVEVLRGLQHVAVVRVDLLEAMLLDAGQVERITGSDENRARKVEDGFAGFLQKLGRHTTSVWRTVRSTVANPTNWYRAGRRSRSLSAAKKT